MTGLLKSEHSIETSLGYKHPVQSFYFDRIS